VSQALEVTRTKFTGGYVPALDGLRGVAILMVLMRHFYNEAIINDGYPFIGPIITKVALSGLYGVELFFVISGFLITQILLDSKSETHYFRNFYVRRFLRIFPLTYGALCLIFFVLPLFVTFDAAAKDIASRQIWLWTYLSNAPWSGGKWDSSGLFRLGHFWFICVVVHYYIIWPLVVYKCELRTLIRICLTGMVVCLLIRAFHTVAGGPELFTWSSIRKIDGLLLGSFLAAGFRLESVSCLINKCAPKVTWVAGLFFLILIFIPRKYMNPTGLTGYYWTVIETISVIFFGGMFILLLRQAVLPSLMQNRVLIAFGKYSFGIYIIHNICWPLFQWLFNPVALLRTVRSPLLTQAMFYVLAISASFLLAFASWHLYEKHFIKLKKIFEYDSKHELEKA
jgi:peptidoglycan/LPS O-acetylase OafA/YrhL